MQENLTPEEKLLHLIKEGATSQKTVTEEASIPHVPRSTYIHQAQQSQSTPLKISTIKIFFKIGLALNIFLLIILGYQWIFGEPVFQISHSKNKDLSSLFLPTFETTPSINIEPSLKIFSSKNIFKSFGEAPPVIQTGDESKSIEDYLKNLYLSGIISGDHPQAIIEDKTNGQFYYVYQGDFIGPLQAIEIGDNYIVLRYGDNEGRLTL